MGSQGEYIVDVSDFAREVVARSHQVPILVDFWAPWCGPCRMLSPILEKLAVEQAGAFILAKVNIDELPEPAGEYGVRGIPAVKLFIQGEPRAGFVGAVPEANVRAFLQQHCPSEVDAMLDAAGTLLAQDDTAGARQAFSRALEHEPGNHKALLGLARLCLREGDLAAARAHAAAMTGITAEREAVQYVLQAADLIEQASALGTRDQVAERVSQDPADMEARMALAGHLLAQGAYRDALEAYVAAAERDRKFRDEAPRKAMLTVFGLIGVRHPLSDEFRKKLMFIY